MTHYEMSNPHAADGCLVPGSGAERLAGVVAHGSMLLAMPLVWPVGVFLASFVMGHGGRYARAAAIQALVFQLIITTVAAFVFTVAGTFFGLAFLVAHIPLLGLLLGPMMALLSWPIALVIALVGGAFCLWGLWVELVATWKAFNGEPYRLPLVGGLGG